MSNDFVWPEGRSRRVINLCPERIPSFGGNNHADRSLAVMMRDMQRRFSEQTDRVHETAEEALTRLGFVRQDG